MMTGRLKIKQIAGITTDELMDYGHKFGKCLICEYEFTVGESFFAHCVDKHPDWIHYKLFEFIELKNKLEKMNLSIFKNDELKEMLLTRYDPFHDEKEIGEPDSLEFQDRMFQPPRCKKCHHNDPDYDVVDDPTPKGDIYLKCVYCGEISVKD